MTEAECVVQDKDIAVVAAFLLDHIQPGHSEVDTALAHANNNVAGALKDDSQIRQGGDVGLILARVRFEHTQSSGSEKFQYIALKAALGGKGESNGLC